MPGVLTSYEVRGAVTDAHGKPIAGAAIEVLRQQIRTRAALTKGITAEDGTYDVRYAPPISGERLLIVVQATSAALSAPLTSPVVDAQALQQVDLSAAPIDTSGWTTTMSSVAALLDGLTIVDVVENAVHQDITFLTRELDIDAETVMRLSIASRLESAFKPPAAVFYAFLAQHVPTTLPSPLIDASDGFTLIDPLVQRVGSLIFDLPPSVQEQVLASAVGSNLIQASYAPQIPSFVAELQALRATDLLTQPYLAGKPTLAQLLDVVKLPPDRQQAFARALAANTASMRNFWRTLGDGRHGFTASEASEIERGVSVGAFVKNHLPLVQLLLDGFGTGLYTSLVDLARLSEKDWIALVTKSGAPASVDAAGGLTPVEVFARVVCNRVARAYPAAALASRVAAGTTLPPDQRAPFALFFRNNPDLELYKINLPVYLAAQGEKAFTGISAEDRPAIVTSARQLQRVLRVAPSVDAAEALLGLGIHSAMQIATMGRQPFLAKATTAGIDPAAADQIFRTGLSRYAATVSLYLQFNRRAVGMWPSAVGRTSDLDGPIAAALQTDPSLASLFGSQDYCQVDECTSVLSPAAYLCDLLLWLRNHPQGTGTTLDVLDSRRADIRHLLLDCANTETALPYVDLVNELLADAISPPTDPASTTNPIWKQTSPSKTADELRAAPEYFNASAFATLAAASYPHTLPYSAGLDELRTYVQQLNVPLWQLRQSLLPVDGATTAARAAVAAERLGMTPHEHDLVANTDFAATDVVWNIASAASAVARVPAFLQASGLSYESMLELLESAWVQGGQAITIGGVNPTCDTTVQSLGPSPLDAGFLDRAHRFLRLWRRAGCKMWELDLLMRAQAVGSGALTEATLVALHAFLDLQRATGLPVDRQLAFFAPVDTATHREPDGTTTTSLYARMFLNPAVTAVAPDADLTALPSGGAIQNPALGSHVAAIQAALGIAAADVALLVSLTDGTLTLANLSLAYRVSALAAATRLSISDLLAVARLLAPAAADAATALAPIFTSPDTTLAFLSKAKAIQQSGFSVDALTYLLAPGPWNTTTQMTDADIESALGAVRQALVAPGSGDSTGSVVAAIAANAHRPADLPLASDVCALLLQTLQVGGKALIALTTDPVLAGDTPITRANYPDQFSAIQLWDKAAVVVRRLRLVAADLGWLVANASVYGGLDFRQLPVVSAQPALTLNDLLPTLLVVKLARLFTASPPQANLQTLYDVISAVHSGTLAVEAAAQAAVATVTGWPASDIASFAGALGLAFPADYTAPATYDALRTAAAMAAKTAATGAQIVDWARTPASESDAEAQAASALGVLKALHPANSDWLTLAPTMMDPIRDRRSAALQAYLTAQRDSTATLLYADVNALFDHFLIDVQMSSCQVSARVVQAYVAVQIFVERCLMNLEVPAVTIDLANDETWNQWEWMKRYRIWQANREIFLYPENWLVESERPNRTETYQTLEQEVRQNASTADYLESVVLQYVDRLDELSNLIVTGTCVDPSGGAVYVVGRTRADPPIFYVRSLVDDAWSGWSQIPLDVRSTLAVPALYRTQLCLFWPDVKVVSEPRQNTTGGSQDVGKYVKLGVNFSTFRNGEWAAAQSTKGRLYDKPLLSSASASDDKSVEALYTIKVQTPAAAAGLGAFLHVDLFRYGDYIARDDGSVLGPYDDTKHIARAVFDGRIGELRQRNYAVALAGAPGMLAHAQATYGPDALPLVPLPDVEAEPEVYTEPNLPMRGGGLQSVQPDPAGASVQTVPLVFTATGLLGENAGPLLEKAPLPFRLIGAVSDPGFNPANDFFFQDNKRCYYVETTKTVLTGSAFMPVAASYNGTAPFEVGYHFHRFYHPFTRLFWHQLSSGGFDALYDRRLQLNPDQVDASGADAFAFQAAYQPEPTRVEWDNDVNGQDHEFLDFSHGAAYSTYNWELFFHIPLYIAETLSQNQQFEDALAWFHYIFDPTQAGTDPAPQRFWIPKPLYTLTAAAILSDSIGELLAAVNAHDADAIAQVEKWRADPFNPFLLADQRPVAYMKRTVMSYLDTLIAWADNLFASGSREALSEATLLYVIASEILGPMPAATPPPPHADQSYDQLEPALDAFANAMVDIENVIGGQGGSGSGSNNGIPPPQTFYFTIPPNDTLLGYWTTVADRLFKLRHCQDIEGQTLQLALFDAPIDPGLLLRAQAAGIDLDSVVADVTGLLPNYRFTFLYGQALDFVNAVRAYGALLLAALEKGDAGQLATLTTTSQLQLLQYADQTLARQVDLAQNAIDVLNQALTLGQDKLTYAQQNAGGVLAAMNSWEIMGMILQSTAVGLNLKSALMQATATVVKAAPKETAGATGSFGTPTATATFDAGDSPDSAAKTWGAFGAMADKSGTFCLTMGKFSHTADDWTEKVTEATDDIAHTQTQIIGAQIALDIAQQNREKNQIQIDQIQTQLDLLTSKFTNEQLYDWMAGQLSDTYFQSFKLAYRLCKQLERCYQFELGIPDSSFIQFGYWDSLHKGLLAGERLNQDLRRMQASYLDENRRRFEVSRYVSLAALDLGQFQRLLATGACDFDVPESLFDHDYPGHYNRHLLRVSVTVVYPSPGKFDNVKATLTLAANKVRVSTDLSSGYAENPVGADPRFAYTYAAVPQKIVLGNAQDDPGLFLTAINNNLGDTRYLPFENAGAISSWHLDMPQASNEIDLANVTDVVLHFFYTAVDGGDTFRQGVQAAASENAAVGGVHVVSARAGATGRGAASEHGYTFGAARPGDDSPISVTVLPDTFPEWRPGRTVTISSIGALAITSSPGTLLLEAAGPSSRTHIALERVRHGSEPPFCAGVVAVAPEAALGTWRFTIRKQCEGAVVSPAPGEIVDLLLVMKYEVH